MQLALFDRVGPATPLASTPPEPPPPVPEGQLDLFGGAALQLRTIGGLLQEDNLPGALLLASELATRLAPASEWRRLLEGWADRIALCGHSPEELAGLAEDGAALPAAGEGGSRLRDALLMGLHLRIARLAEQRAPGALVGDRPAGWHYLLAGRVEEARTSLTATIATRQREGLCCVLLGNLAWKEGSVPTARAWYQQGFLSDPFGTPVDQIADPAIPELLDDAAELELTPAAAWAPLVGQARSLFGVARLTSVDASVARFQALLQEARSGSTPARRELKTLAPALFVVLRDEGKL